MVKDDEILDRGIIRTIDPQVIYIVGNKEREIPRNSSTTTVRSKRDTLERFIRNNQNVNIISYDELYKRAYQICPGRCTGWFWDQGRSMRSSSSGTSAGRPSRLRRSFTMLTIPLRNLVDGTEESHSLQWQG